MKILFVNACLGGDFSAMDLGITSLASYLNAQTPHRAAIADLVFHRRHWRQHLWREIQGFHPDWLAVSTNTMYMQYVRDVVAQVRGSGIPILLGGHHASIHPEECLEMADAVCIGDGEYRLAEFLDAGGRAADIPGMWDHQSRNPGGSFIQNLDALPSMDWLLWRDLPSYYRYLNMIYMSLSRGCPYSCRFCDVLGIKEAVQGRFFRQMSPEGAASELVYQARRLQHLRPGLFQLFDPVFTVNRRWLEVFTQEYGHQGKPLRYSCFSRIDNLDEDRIAMLAESGCAVVRVGIESGNEHIRREVYRKDITNDQVREVSELCRRYGIAMTAYYILGGPGETRATLRDSLDMAWRLDAARTAFFVYKPFTSGASALLAEHGGYVDTARWERAENISFGAVVNTGGVSPRTVEWYQKWAYLKTFGRRWLRIVRRDHVRYPWGLARYIVRGVGQGLDPRYLLIYFHIYHGRNVDH